MRRGVQPRPATPRENSGTAPAARRSTGALSIWLFAGAMLVVQSILSGADPPPVVGMSLSALAIVAAIVYVLYEYRRWRAARARN